MIDFLSQPWPWYVSGPLIGLIVPLLLIFDGRRFGISSSFRHICAATLPASSDYFRYDWRKAGTWNLVFVVGLLIGGVLSATVIANPSGSINLAANTVRDLTNLGITDFSGLVPDDVFSWSALTTLPGFASVILGGFLVGFGARYGNGCTSGHGITGLATLQITSLVAIIGFFVGGLFVTHLILPLILN